MDTNPDNETAVGARSKCLRHSPELGATAPGARTWHWTSWCQVTFMSALTTTRYITTRKGHNEDEKSRGGRIRLNLAYVLLAAIAFLTNGDLQGTQMGTTHGQQVHDFTRAQHKRCTHTYKQSMADNKYIKSHKMVQFHSQGMPKYMDIIIILYLVELVIEVKILINIVMMLIFLLKHLKLKN